MIQAFRQATLEKDKEHWADGCSISSRIKLESRNKEEQMSMMQESESIIHGVFRYNVYQALYSFTFIPLFFKWSRQQHSFVNIEIQTRLHVCTLAYSSGPASSPPHWLWVSPTLHSGCTPMRCTWFDISVLNIWQVGKSRLKNEKKKNHTNGRDILTGHSVIPN